MTTGEARPRFSADAIARARHVRDCGLYWVQLIIHRRRAPRGERVQLWPGGPKARVVGPISHGDWMVEVGAPDILRHAEAER